MLKTGWRNQKRVCHCGAKFMPKREGQRHCSRDCRVRNAMSRYRSDNTKRPRVVVAGSDNTASSAPPLGSESRARAFTTNFTEVLKGDDYPLEYYPDGYPKLPACLDRRRFVLAEAA